ncbi:CsgG/HfaB family protein [Psychroserpens algicola]|uniref:FlgO domain-containing protein n=1 Tax=Psychroserpens algicola TaxID=1719034 RepID=A0ABT0H995_9FLAO|nr:CsgG/HfaB family protein [Psychroserpens algicola]MCK8480930.1 hypothetical protein [Psychroserpens algicola]
MNKLQTSVLVLFFFTIQMSHAQDFDNSISKVIESISSDLNEKGNENFQIAIYPFKYNKENEDVLAEYVNEEFWDIMPKSAINYEVMDRATFDEYFQEHSLKSKGLIDPKTEKQFGMLIAADAYITGKVYVFNSIIRLRVTVTDTQTGKIITTASGKLPITYDIATYMGLKNWKEKKIEAEKNKSSNPNCDKENVGDICFQNNSTSMYEIKIQDIDRTISSIHREITIDTKEYGCFKNLPAQAYSYRFRLKNSSGISYKKGNFYINICQSKVIELE